MSLVVPCSHDNFAIIGQASSRFALKIKERLHRLWKKTNSRTGQTRSVLFDIVMQLSSLLPQFTFYRTFCLIQTENG